MRAPTGSTRRTGSSTQAVLDAYGWPHDLSDEEILARLLALNLERAACWARVASALERRRWSSRSSDWKFGTKHHDAGRSDPAGVCFYHLSDHVC
jgi:hypothetical protein